MTWTQAVELLSAAAWIIAAIWQVAVLRYEHKMLMDQNKMLLEEHRAWREIIKKDIVADEHSS